MSLQKTSRAFHLNNENITLTTKYHLTERINADIQSANISSFQKFDVRTFLWPKTVTSAPDHVDKLCESRMSLVIDVNSLVLQIEVGSPFQILVHRQQNFFGLTSWYW